MIYFLKLGGSLITDKNTVHSYRPKNINRLAQEIALAIKNNPKLQLVLGHGSGSFGHAPAKKYGTRDGASTPADWRGFIEVWNEARTLNQIIVDALYQAGMQTISLPPSASVITKNHVISKWDLQPLKAAMKANLIPLIFGDVVFDIKTGATILSTEELFQYLALRLKPKCILIAGQEKGVWEDFPACTKLLKTITLKTYPQIKQKILGSSAMDVTGGMAEKVHSMFTAIEKNHALKTRIFSGEEPGSILQALQGKSIGTILEY